MRRLRDQDPDLPGLGTAPLPDEAALQDVAAAAAEVARAPVGLVALLHEGRWSAVAVGSDVVPVPQLLALCADLLGGSGPVVVEDALAHPAFRDHPSVAGGAGVRSCAVVPLVTSAGGVRGALCVADTEPRALDDGQRRVLQVLADQVAARLELARQARDASADEAAAAAAAAAERTVQEQHRALFERSPVGQAEIAPGGEVLRVNEAFTRLMGRPAEDLVGRTVGDLAGLSPGEARMSARAAAGTGPRSTEHVFQRPDGTAVQAQVSTAAVRGPDGSVQAVVATVVDMTERNAARAALEHLVDELRVARDESDRRAALLDAVLDTIDVGVVACDADGRLTLFNRAARDFHGLGEDPDLDPGQWSERFRFWDEAAAAPLPPEDVPLSRALVDGQVHDRLVTLAAEGGPPRVVRCDGRALPGPDGAVAGAVVAMKDVTALRASEQRFRAAFHDGPAPMARLDAAGAVREANPALRRFLSLPSSRLLGRPLADLLHPDDAAVLPHVLAGTGAEPAEARVVRADGAPVWCEIATTAGAAADGEQYVLVQLLDVDARKTNELELERIARVDPLTGLGNRTVLRTELARHLDPGVGTGAAVLFLDLDGFKQVNDVHGHSAGDAVLVETAARLQLAVRPGDTVVRTGGDEFVVVCPLPAPTAGGPADGGASALAERVEQALSRPVVHRGGLLPAAASVGSAVGRPGEDVEALLRRADLVMYGRKAARRTHGAGDPAEQVGGELA